MPFKLKASFPGRLNERPGRGDGKSNGKCIITKVSTTTCLVVCVFVGFLVLLWGVCLLLFVFGGTFFSFLFFFFLFLKVCVFEFVLLLFCCLFV